MAHGGVPLHRYGQGEVDGASLSYLCQGEEDRHQVEPHQARAYTKICIIMLVIFPLLQMIKKKVDPEKLN